ncbi:hypothetical protein TcBrA4_0024570 [Trypanosoma cruzi]|nr:hypothetical protein TcBrA4_0024570 [Trypanosoma cruzi]
MAMMTGRVLLVCALCVLWCGAGGIHARDIENNAGGGCVTSGVFEGKTSYLSSGCHKTTPTLPLRSMLPIAALQADDREEEVSSTKGAHLSLNGKLGAGGGSPSDSSPGDTFVSFTPFKGGASTPQKNNPSGAGGQSDATLSPGSNMDALKTSNLEGDQESINKKDKAADSLTGEGESKNEELQGRRATEGHSPGTSLTKILPPPPPVATQPVQAPTSQGPPSAQLTNEPIKPENPAGKDITRVQTTTPQRPEVEEEAEPAGKTPEEGKKFTKEKEVDQNEQKEKDEKEHEQPQEQQQQQQQFEREKEVPPLASPLGEKQRKGHYQP